MAEAQVEALAESSEVSLEARPLRLRGAAYRGNRALLRNGSERCSSYKKWRAHPLMVRVGTRLTACARGRGRSTNLTFPFLSHSFRSFYFSTSFQPKIKCNHRINIDNFLFTLPLSLNVLCRLGVGIVESSANQARKRVGLAKKGRRTSCLSLWPMNDKSKQVAATFIAAVRALQVTLI